MYEDDDELEGPKSSFDTYFAEGDVLFKKGEFKKALESYSLVRCWKSTVTGKCWHLNLGEGTPFEYPCPILILLVKSLHATWFELCSSGWRSHEGSTRRLFLISWKLLFRSCQPYSRFYIFSKWLYPRFGVDDRFCGNRATYFLKFCHCELCQHAGSCDRIYLLCKACVLFSVMDWKLERKMWGQPHILCLPALAMISKCTHTCDGLVGDI